VVVGILATLTGLGALAVMVYAMGVAPQVASWPSLLLGAAVQFIGNREWAFAARAGCVKRQLLGFTLVEIVTLGLNGGIYHVLIVVGPSREDWDLWPMAARLATESAVFLAWSYPMWRLVFGMQTGPGVQAGPAMQAGPVDESTTRPPRS
jgi:putative flippase GtrA